uniref:Uncharacterized protein n=1 Tax=Daphnia magna TaxID=35525 RepID=A0A0P5ZUM3_9CRUS
MLLQVWYLKIATFFGLTRSTKERLIRNENVYLLPHNTCRIFVIMSQIHLLVYWKR